MSKGYLHDMSKQELIAYVEKIQECQLTFKDLDAGNDIENAIKDEAVAKKTGRNS